MENGRDAFAETASHGSFGVHIRCVGFSLATCEPGPAPARSEGQSLLTALLRRIAQDDGQGLRAGPTVRAEGLCFGRRTSCYTSLVSRSETGCLAHDK
jgi:hypothetical protein